MNIVFVGAGNVGSSTAFLTLEKKLGTVKLIDVNENVAVGKAIDLSQAFETIVEGSSKFELLKGADVVVVSAGAKRNENMTREQLLQQNEDVIKNICEQIKSFAPNSKVIIITNPVDKMTITAQSILGEKNVIKMGNQLDSKRFKYYIAKELGINADGINCEVIGEHNTNMQPLVEKASVDGKALTSIASKEQIDRIVDNTKNGGAKIIELIGTSAYYAPAMATVRIIESLKK
jgi:malate dehydrogenase